MHYKVAIFGSSVSADGKRDAIPNKTAAALGKALGEHKVTIVTGACTGIPYQVAYKGAKQGAEVIGFSPEIDFDHQKQFAPDDDLSIYKEIIYIPSNFPFISVPEVCKKYRNVMSTATADAGIIISGRWGTMNEFTNLYDMGKVIGVLTGFGGIADELPSLSKKINKQSKAKVFFSDNPDTLVSEIINELKQRQ